jgi:hypothetical protein
MSPPNPRRPVPNLLHFAMTLYHDAAGPKITTRNIPGMADLLRRAARHTLENAGDEPQAQADAEVLRDLADRLLDARDRIVARGERGNSDPIIEP